MNPVRNTGFVKIIIMKNLISNGMKKYIVGLFVAVSLIALPLVSQAYSIAELQTLIAKLQAQLSAMQNSQSAPACRFTHDLSLGDGEDDGLTKEISALQQVLISGGFLKIQKPTGYFGKLTMGAVKQWQNATNKFAVTGEIGSNDRGVLCGKDIERICQVSVTCPVQQRHTLERYENGCPVYRCVPDDNNNNGQISINSISGPNSLGVGQSGTWSLNVSAPTGSNLTYAIDWGDYYPYPTNTGLKSSEVEQGSTFNHSYRQAGKYTINFTVKAGFTPTCPPCEVGYTCAPCLIAYKAKTAQASMTVVVGETTFPIKPVAFVISPNGGEQWSLGSVQTITWKTNVPASNKITVRLRDSSGNEHYVYGLPGDMAPNTGALSFMVPPTLSVGLYKAEVKAFINGESYLDASDNYLSIVKPTPVCAQDMSYVCPGTGVTVPRSGPYCEFICPVLSQPSTTTAPQSSTTTTTAKATTINQLASALTSLKALIQALR